MQKYQTADGQIFKQIGDARLHAKSLTDSTVKEVEEVAEALEKVEDDKAVKVAAKAPIKKS